MALITNATTDWSAPVTLTEDEVWQARRGSVYVTTTSSPDAQDGIILQENHAVQFNAGRTVRYRRVDIAEAVIAREAV